MSALRCLHAQSVNTAEQTIRQVLDQQAEASRRSIMTVAETLIAFATGGLLTLLAQYVWARWLRR